MAHGLSENAKPVTRIINDINDRGDHISFFWGPLFTPSGHDLNGSVRGTAEEVFKRIKHQRNNSQFLRKVQLLAEDGTDINVDSMNLEISNPYYPENILNIHLNRFESIQKMRLVNIGFENLKEQGLEKLELRLLDSGLVTKRPLVSLGQFNGDLITIKPSCKSNHSFEHHYDVVLDQTRFLEKDKSKNCVDYPTEEFEDYQSCDDSFQREFIRKHSPYKPFWAFGRQSNEEPNHPYVKSAHVPINLLYTGATRSSCSLPCTTTVAKTKFRFEKESEGKDIETLNWVVFYLPNEVRVTETLFMDTSVGEVLSDIGGTLGLWLGLGVLQLFQSIAALKYNVAKKTSEMVLNHD